MEPYYHEMAYSFKQHIAMQKKNKTNTTPKQSDCTRCGGTGYLEQYKHIENGRCFKCR